MASDSSLIQSIYQRFYVVWFNMLGILLILIVGLALTPNKASGSWVVSFKLTKAFI